MATNLSDLTLALRTQLSVISTLSNNLSAPVDNMTIDDSDSITFGYDASECDQVYYDTITLAGGAVEDLDLQDLTNGFGLLAAFGTVKMILIINRSTEGDGLEVGGDAVDPFIGWFGDAADTEIIAPLGKSLHTEFIDGWWTDLGAILQLTNLDAVTDCKFDIVIVGTDDTEGSSSTP